jgi:hypothetical protein
METENEISYLIGLYGPCPFHPAGPDKACVMTIVLSPSTPKEFFAVFHQCVEDFVKIFPGIKVLA